MKQKKCNCITPCETDDFIKQETGQIKTMAEYTKEELLSLPKLDRSLMTTLFDSVIIVPTEQLTVGTMYLILVNSLVPIFKLPYQTDVLFLDGVGGYGTDTTTVIRKGWIINILPKSGTVHLVSKYKLEVHFYDTTSSVQIYSHHEYTRE